MKGEQMNRLALGLMIVAALAMAGCATEQTRRIVKGEDTEVTSGISEEDLRIIVRDAMDNMRKKSYRFVANQCQQQGVQVPAKVRRIVNVKPFTIDTTARGSQAGYLADSLKIMFEEEMMNMDDDEPSAKASFILYNEDVATQTGNAPVRPEFILNGKLREQNVRRDNGNFYKENSLILRLTDVATTLDFWQTRVPLQKAVDKTNVLN